MTLITQDGRTLEMRHAENLRNECVASVEFWHGGDWRTGKAYSVISVAEFELTADGKTKAVIYRQDVGIFKNSEAHKVSAAIWQAFNSGMECFIVPNHDDETAKVCAEHEETERLIKEHGLIVASIHELGYSKEDTARNLHIWQTTDEFERRNILIVDENGSYEKSLAKWKALQRKIA